MGRIVRKTLNDYKPTAAQIKRLQALATRPDSEIDLSDMPELDEKFWRNAVPNPFYRPIKKQLTVRLDADVIAWLRRQGKGYQTRMNALLRDAMLKEAAPKRRRAS
ncbi:MAG: BrnA antitoxin family protein [Acidobacteriaceae bacterium]